MNTTPELVETLSRIDTPTLANACELLNVRNRMSGFCSRTLRQLTPDMGVLCGYAVTVHALTATPETFSREEGVAGYMQVCRALEKAPKPAVVVIQEFGPHPEYATHLGEVLGTLFQRFGAIGVVSDSAIRDLDELHAIRFQAFAPGTVSSHGNLVYLRVQEPVMICGLTVHPGDLLHGDKNGLLTVPAEGREKLPELVERVRAKEKKLLDVLRGEAPVTIEDIQHLMTH